MSELDAKVSMRATLESMLTGAKFTGTMLPHVASRVFNEPLAIEPGKLGVILAGLGSRLGLQGLRAEAAPTLITRDRRNDYSVVNGIATIAVMGTIVKRNEGNVLAESGQTSLTALRETVATAMSDPDVKAIILHVDSYGGEAVGTPEAARFMFDARGTKPMWAVLDDAGYSAGYYLAAAADRVVVSPSGGGGSIGVIALHVDQSTALEAEGIKVTPIFAGDYKADGFDVAPLTERARSRMQARVDGLWEIFVRDVAEFRGMSRKSIREMQAGTFYGSDLVSAGLADAVMTYDEAFTALSKKTAKPSSSAAKPARGIARAEGAPMPEDITKEPRAEGTTDVVATKPPADVISLADHRRGTEQAAINARELESARINGILEAASIAVRAGLPRDSADKLAMQWIKDPSMTSEKAGRAFLDACAARDASKTVVGHTADEDTEASIKAPKMKPREEVLAARERASNNARFGSRDGFDRFVSDMRGARA